MAGLGQPGGWQVSAEGASVSDLNLMPESTWARLARIERERADKARALAWAALAVACIAALAVAWGVAR